MNIAILLVLWLIMIAMLFLVFIGFCLLWKRIQEEKRVVQKETYKKRTEAFWYEYFINNAPLSLEFIPVKEEEIEGYEEITKVYVDSITSERIGLKLHTVASSFLHHHYKKKLDSSKWSFRLNALSRIKDYGNIETIKGSKWVHQKDKTKEEIILLLSIYAQYEEASFFEMFLKYQPTLTEFDCRKIFASLPESILSRLFSMFDRLEAASQYTLIDIVAVERNVDFIDVLYALVNHEGHEIRIRAAKAIYEIGVVDAKLCEQLSKAERWEERLMAAKLGHHVLFSEGKGMLFQLLEDTQWQVRDQAARTIIHHKDGAESLHLYVESSTDHYAIETVREVLEREGDRLWVG